MHCPTCGAAVTAEMRVCSTCNSTLEAPAAEAKAPRKRRSKAAEAAPSPKASAQPKTESTATTKPKRRNKSKLAAQVKAVFAMIDDLMLSYGITDLDEFTDDNGTRFIPVGSVEVQIQLIELEDDSVYVRAAVPICDLPSDKDLIVPLMRYLLEWNINGAEHFALDESTVCLLAMRNIEHMQPEELEELVSGVMHLADVLDEEIIATYGGTSKQRSA
jgi:hypothetical protein